MPGENQNNRSDRHRYRKHVPFGNVRIIETELRRYGYTLLLGNTGDSAVRELGYLREFIGKNVEGIILIHASDGVGKIGKKIKDLIREGNIPTVMLDYDMEDLDVIRCVVDNEQGGYIATRHLLEKGHTKIGSLLGPMGQCSVRNRLKGINGHWKKRESI